MKICFTGHRPNKLINMSSKNNYWQAYYDIIHPILYKVTFKVLEDLLPSITFAYNGMAIGFDDISCRCLQDLDINYIACIPFSGQEDRWYDHRAKSNYVTALKNATSVHNLEPRSGHELTKKEVCALMFQRDNYMVDNSDLVIALYNGDEKGGTAYTVKYAQKKGKPILNLWHSYIEQLKANGYSL